MSSRYIELGNNIIVEVGTPGERREEMHSAVLDRVDTTLEMVGNVVEAIVRPIGEAFVNLQKSLNVPIEVSKAELELGLSFSAEGNIFVTKAKAEGSLNIKIEFSPTKVIKSDKA